MTDKNRTGQQGYTQIMRELIRTRPLASLLVALLLMYATAATITRAATKSWPFDNSGKYVYDPVNIDVSGSLADMITQDWWDNDWQYRRKIVVDNSGGGAQTNFQVLVELDSGNFDFASAQLNGEDIRFVNDTNDTTYDYWRQSYDQGAETGEFWVEVPSVPAAATMAMYIYYGNPSAPDGSSYNDVFYFVGEIGFSNQDPIDGVWTSISFTNAFSAAPVVINTIQTAVDYPQASDNTNAVGPITGNNCGGGDGYADGTAEPRVRNITTNGFDYRMFVKSLDCDNIHGTEKLAWMALLPGTHVIGDRVVRVFTTNLGNGNENYSTVNFGFTFTDNPVILPQIQSYNEAGTAGIRLHNKTTQDVDAKIEEASDGQYHALESVGFVVLDQAGFDDVMGSNLGPGLEGEVGSTNVGAVQHIFQSSTFQHAFAFAPAVLFKVQNDNGGNNVHERLRNITTTGFEQACSENFYATSNSYDGNHFNDEGGSFIAIANTNGPVGYDYRKRITIDNTGGGALANFNMQIDLDAANFADGFANAKADGSDIMFTAADGFTMLGYYYDPAAYDQAGQSATFMVNLPNVPAGGTLDIYIYYGNPNAVSYSDSQYSTSRTIVGEAGVTPDAVEGINNGWYTVNFTNTYSAPPVVVASMNKYDGAQETHTRVRNVTTTSFQVTCEESVDRDGGHTTETVGWIAMEEGSYTIDGTRFDAWRQNNVDHNYDTLNYPGGNFPAPPTVISIQETMNNQFQAGSSHTRIKNVGTNTFDLAVEECDNTEGALNNETIMIIAAERNNFNSGGGAEGSYSVIEAARNNSWVIYNHPFSFSAEPAIVPQIMSENEGDASHIRVRNSFVDNFQWSIEEARSLDGNHVNESLGNIAFAQGNISVAAPPPVPYPTTAFAAQENLNNKILLYARKYQGTSPSVTIDDVETYNNDPWITPIEVFTVSFDQVNSFTEILGPGTGEMRYQISNDYSNWYYVATSTGNWNLAATASYYEANTATQVDADIDVFDDQIGNGSFYFKAILHQPTVADDVSVDQIDIDYDIPAAAPDITGIAPNPDVLFATVTISGSDFGIVQGASRVFFNGCEATANVVSWGPNSIDVKVPDCASDGPVTVIVGPYISNEWTFNIETPAISYMQPPRGDFFQVINIYGSDFGFVQGNSYVQFSPGVYASIVSWDDTLIKCLVPSSAVTGNVNVVTPGGPSNNVPFTITPDQSRWPFSTPTNYIYGPLITDTGNFAELVPINVPQWLDRQWLYRRQIDFNNNGGKPAEFQVRLDLSAASFGDGFTKARSGGEDLRVTRTDGTTLVDFWIESWDADAETARIWIEMPDVATENSVYIYYGNSAAPSVSSYTDTLDFVGQAGTASNIDSNWNNVSLSANFAENPVVAGTMVTTYDGDAGHVRARNIDFTSQNMQLTIENSRNAGSGHGNESVGWLAVRPGSWFIGSRHVEAATTGPVNRTWTGWLNYANAFGGQPAILALQQTAAVFQPGGADSTQIRIDNDGGSATRFRMRLERDDDSQPADFGAGETTVGYIAIETGDTDDSLPNLVGHADIETDGVPNVFYWTIVDTVAPITSAPAVISTINTVNDEGGEDAAHARIQSVTDASFQIQAEECRDCSEGHAAEDYGWYAIEPGLIYGRKYGDPEPAATVNAEETIIYTNTSPTIQPNATDGEGYDGLAGFYELLGFENQGSVQYQVTNDGTFTNWYYHDGLAWATATLGVAESNTAIELDTYLPDYSIKYGTGTFWFKAYLISDGTQLVQLDGVGIVKITENQSHYMFATNQAVTPLFYENDQPAALNKGKPYLLAIQIEHEGATGTYNFQLQFRKDPWGAPGPWTSITPTSTDWKAMDGPWGNHLDPVTSGDFEVNGGAGTGFASDGYYSEEGIVQNYLFGSGTFFTELWYAITPETTIATDTYQFRVVNGVSPNGFRYPVYPYVGPPPTDLTVDITDDDAYDDITHGGFPVIDMTLTCTDAVGPAPCDAGDFMRFACDETQLPGTPYVAYQTPYNGVFDITAGPGCDNTEGLKTVFFQVKNNSDFLQLAPATATTYYDKTDPVIDNTTTIEVTSDMEAYFYGTADGLACLGDAAPVACTTWFQNLPGGGVDQDITVKVVEGTYTEVNPWKFDGDTAFGDNPAVDMAAAGDWTQTYEADVAIVTHQSNITFTFHDRVSGLGNHTDTFDITFRRDADAPDPLAGVTGYEDISQPMPALTSGNWYNHSNPLFTWAEPADNPAVLPSGVQGYYVVFSTDPGAVPVTLHTSTQAWATGPLAGDASWTYYLNIKVVDNVGNETTVSNYFEYRYDTATPTLVYNYPAGAGLGTTWYNADPADIIDVDLGFGTASPLAQYEYQIAAAGWNNIWAGSMTATYTTNWALPWGALSDGENEISLRGTDEAGNVITEMFATTTAGFVFRKDTVSQVIDYNTPATGSNTVWYNADPGVAIDIDLLWASSAPIIDFEYNIDGGAWTSIWSGSQRASYTGDWALPWASMNEGTTQIGVRGTDAAGNVTTDNYVLNTSGFLFRKDTWPPQFDYNTPATGGATVWYGADPGDAIDVDLLWASNSPLVQLDYKIGAGGWTSVWSGAQSADYTTDWGITWAALAEGDNEISLRGIDTAGNVKVENYALNTAGFLFRKDVTDPIIDYNTPATGSNTVWYNADPGDVIDIDMLWSSGSPLVNFAYNIDGGAWSDIWNGTQSADYTTDWGITWAALAEGTNQIGVRATDAAGRVTTDNYVLNTSGFLFRKDTQAPIIDYNTPATGTTIATWYNADPGDIIDIDLLWGSNAPLAQFDYKIGAGGWTSLWSGAQSADYTTDWGVSWAALPDGENEISLRGFDTAGNVTTDNYAAGVAGFIIRKDTAPPLFNYNSPATGAATTNWYSSDPGNIIDIDLDWASGSPYVRYRYQVGAGPWRQIWAGTQSADYTTDWGVLWGDLADGENQVNIDADDQAGNTSTDNYALNTSGFIFRKDTLAPDNPAGVNAWASSTKLTVITTGNPYEYERPYFEWAAPNDNPAAPNSGVAGYYVAFATNTSFDITATAPLALGSEAMAAAPPECGATYTLYMRTFDNAVPAPNISATASLFTYYFDCGVDPDYLAVVPQDDAIITADYQATDWCFGAGCAGAACNYGGNDRWCTDKTVRYILDKPDFVKYDNGGGIQRTLTNIASETAPASTEWSWDPDDYRIILSDDPSPGTATVTYTPYQGSEEVCVSLYDASDTLMVGTPYQTSEVQLELTTAPGSGKDITSEGSIPFTSISTPAGGDFTPFNQTTVKGQLNGAQACVILTADDLPTDTPNTPITITSTYFDKDTGFASALANIGGAQSTGLVYIRFATGVASGQAGFGGYTDVEDGFTPDPNLATQGIVLAPDWSNDGSRIVFNSLQSNPCSGAAAVGNTPYNSFNLYTLSLSGGILTDCARLTSNGVADDGTRFGPAAHSEVTWNSASDKIVLSAYDYEGVQSEKLLWVDATVAAGAATGTQFDVPVISEGAIKQDTLDISANPGDTVLTVGDTDKYAVNDSIFIGSLNFMNEIDYYEIVTVTAKNPAADTITVNPALANSYLMASTVIYNPASLKALGQYMVPVLDGSRWLDPDWTPDNNACNANYRDVMIAVRIPSALSEDVECGPTICGPAASPSTNANIVMFSGGKDANGMFRITDSAISSPPDINSPSTLSKITDFPTGEDIWPLKPKFSPDCTMIAFLAVDEANDVAGNPSDSSVYIINLENNSAGFQKATLPVTSLSDQGVYKVYDYASGTYTAFSPNWSADGKLVSYALDKSQTFNYFDFMGSDLANVVNNVFSGADFDMYMEYIMDQPPSQGAIFAPQPVGRVSDNEISLVQCPGNLVGSTCPDGPNYPMAHVAQMYSQGGSYLRLLKFTDESTVSSEGGILFQDGLVTAVFPPNVVASDTVFWNDAPTAYCGGAMPGGANCPLDPSNDFIVQAGEAREYFPDGTNFDTYVRLIFHYCDNDDDGYLDAGTEGIMAATSGGTQPFTFNPLDGSCQINGNPTSGGTIDVDTVAVYNWDTANAQWLRMEGYVDKAAKTVTVFTTHFSHYETLGFRYGQQGAFQPLMISDVHTYPNPYVAGRHTGGITFAAGDVLGDSAVELNIRIYDLRGSLITTLVRNIPDITDTQDLSTVSDSYTLLEWPRPVNAAGRHLASGIYLYYLYARDGRGFEVTHKGKFTVVR